MSVDSESVEERNPCEQRGDLAKTRAQRATQFIRDQLEKVLAWIRQLVNK